ncbi:hypothetical protein [Gymnodinialimonas ulvae]|uniref:hypothetical protein n=1 Tax=Gymnodinialimonas ulvae TaxID=3126504 RepID=UPI0030A10B16
MTPNTFPDFRAAHPDCALLVLSDIRSRTVLAADGALAYPQEYLDAISTSAFEIMAQSATRRTWALFLTPNGIRAFRAVPHLGNVALTCLMSPDADVDIMLAQLDTLAQGIEPWEAAA